MLTISQRFQHTVLDGCETLSVFVGSGNAFFIESPPVKGWAETAAWYAERDTTHAFVGGMRESIPAEHCLSSKNSENLHSIIVSMVEQSIAV